MHPLRSSLIDGKHIVMHIIIELITGIAAGHALLKPTVTMLLCGYPQNVNVSTLTLVHINFNLVAGHSKSLQRCIP